jgi:predicted ABC-type ATPase
VSIYVLAGTNGGGKSSIGGAMIRAAGADYFNPDEAARQIASANPGAPTAEVNSAAWHEGKRLLERAIAQHGNFAFETTLGGATMTRLLEDAIDAGIDVHLWYVALESPELHLARVRERVSRGGHDIPERDVRRRYDESRQNLIKLLHGLASLRVYDNSADADPGTGTAPTPRLLLHMEHRRIVHHCDLATAPEWVKPILLTALRDPGE